MGFGLAELPFAVFQQIQVPQLLLQLRIAPYRAYEIVGRIDSRAELGFVFVKISLTFIDATAMIYCQIKSLLSVAVDACGGIVSIRRRRTRITRRMRYFGRADFRIAANLDSGCFR
ncbi:hypothetical protein ASF56_21505 [Methylobacterium sp. Leaf122]|nr:hypothetical protein ASF56_21505 [Methylobacterium sp. Leaf122]